MVAAGIITIAGLYLMFRVGKWVGRILKRARQASENAKPLIEKYGKEGKSRD